MDTDGYIHNFINFKSNAHLITEAVNQLPALLDRIKKLEGALRFYADHNNNWRKDIKTGQSNIVNDQDYVGSDLQSHDNPSTKGY